MIKIVLVGNQNSGKTTLFNLLTGNNQKIGNWPGVTIEQKIGTIKGTNFEIVDLPGIYSLSPYTQEEEISRKFVFEEDVDLIINIVDATSLERSLYLTTQLQELDCKMIIALNMTDIMEKKGVTIDIDELSKDLGIPIVPISALKGSGIDKLIKKIKHVDKIEKEQVEIYEKDIESEISKIVETISAPHKRFIAVKVLENDQRFLHFQSEEIKEEIKKLEKSYGIDLEQLIANQRYNYIVSVKIKSVREKIFKDTLNDKLDRIFLHKYFALPIFALIMFGVYFLSVGVIGSATVGLIERGFDSFSLWFKDVLVSLNASPWAVSLVIDGIVVGVSAVLAFIPQLMILFLCISLLETTGYMSRIAFFLDRIFSKFGLSGKSLIPFIIGSGCSVPAVMATRTIEDQKEKEMTIILTPFVPCSAKLPIIALFSGYFFGSQAGIVSASLYFMAILVIVLSAIIMKKFIYKRKSSTFITELPEYKRPKASYVARDVWDKTWEFIKRAGTIILFCSIIVWVLLSFTWSFRYIDGVAYGIEDSILASIGKVLAYAFYPMLGELSWGATVSAIQGLIAKEQVISSMNIIAGLDGSSVSTGIFQTGIFSFFGKASAYAFIAFNLFSAPCIATISAMRKELGSTKKMIYAISFQTGMAWIIAVAIFWLGTLLGG